MTSQTGRESGVLLSLRRAHHFLAQAAGENTPAARYANAHLAALRAASALVEAGGKPIPVRRRRQPVRSVWPHLIESQPELAEWADYFSTRSLKRALAEAGIRNAVTASEAETHLGKAEAFVALVEDALGVQAQPPLPLRVVRD